MKNLSIILTLLAVALFLAGFWFSALCIEWTAGQLWADADKGEDELDD